MAEKRRTVVDGLAEWLAILGGFVVFILMALMVVDAIGRKTWGAVPGAFEFSEALMIPAVFLPLMFVQSKREHVFVGVVTMALSNRSQCFLDAVAAIVGMAIFGFLTWLALIKALDSTMVNEYRVAVISVPIWPFRWVIVIGTGLMVLQLLMTAVEEFGRAFGEEEPQMAEAELR
jgi:TRAP-type mannitol/chloroaromatic compound transport system permease small subunit